MSTIPNWIVVMQALLTPAIAAAVAVIGFLQWRTAHQKVMIDVFDRRIAVIREVDDAILHALAGQGNMAGYDATRRIWAAYGDAIYLFGPEVGQLISNIRDNVSRYAAALRRLENPRYSAEQREQAAEQEIRLERELMEARTQLKECCLPYVHMPQKKVRSPLELFHHLNTKRSSYAYGDEEQRK